MRSSMRWLGMADILMVRKLAVRVLPGSATPAEQLALAGIDAAAIVMTAADMVTRRSELPGPELPGA